MHSLIVRLNYMYLACPAATPRMLTTTNRFTAAQSFLRMTGFAEPRPHGRKHSHEAAGLQQLAAEAPAGTQVVVQIFLVNLIHVQETVGGLPRESGILYIFSYRAGTLLLATPKQAAAIVMMMFRLDTFHFPGVVLHGVMMFEHCLL